MRLKPSCLLARRVEATCLTQTCSPPCDSSMQNDEISPREVLFAHHLLDIEFVSCPSFCLASTACLCANVGHSRDNMAKLCRRTVASRFFDISFGQIVSRLDCIGLKSKSSGLQQPDKGACCAWFGPLTLQDRMQAAGMTAEASLVIWQGDSRDNMAKPCNGIAAFSFFDLTFGQIFD